MKPAAYAKLRKQFEQAERDLVRAQRKWDRLRVRIRRADATADRALGFCAAKADFRDMIEPRPDRAHLLLARQAVRS